jgi:hypothetical protein
MPFAAATLDPAAERFHPDRDQNNGRQRNEPRQHPQPLSSDARASISGPLTRARLNQHGRSEIGGEGRGFQELDTGKQRPASEQLWRVAFARMRSRLASCPGQTLPARVHPVFTRASLLRSAGRVAHHHPTPL